MLSESGRGLGMLFPLREVTRDSVLEQLSEPLSLLHGLSFVPTGAHTETERSVARTYTGEGMIGRALAVLGPDGACVMYFIMGPPEEAAGYDAVLESLLQTTRFADPESEPESPPVPL